MNIILKITAVVIFLVAVTYLIVSTFFMSGDKANTTFDGFGNMVSPTSRTNTTSKDELEVNIDKVLINMHSGYYKYMKADMAFKMKDTANKDALVEQMSDIRNTILHFSSNQDSNKLATPEGKQQYKKDLIDLIYESYGLSIEDIYFRDFVLAQ